MGAVADKIARLEAEIDKLKAARPTEIDPAAVAAHRDAMHQASERRMSNAYVPSRAELAAYRAAAPDDVCGGLVHDNRGPTGPKGIIPSTQQVSNVRVGGAAGPPGGGTGWMREAPLSSPPGTNYADKLMDQQDRRDRHELIVAEAKRQALIKAAGKAR